MRMPLLAHYAAHALYIFAQRRQFRHRLRRQFSGWLDIYMISQASHWLLTTRHTARYMTAGLQRHLRAPAITAYFADYFLLEAPLALSTFARLPAHLRCLHFWLSARIRRRCFTKLSLASRAPRCSIFFIIARFYRQQKRSLHRPLSRRFFIFLSRPLSGAPLP